MKNILGFAIWLVCFCPLMLLCQEEIFEIEGAIQIGDSDDETPDEGTIRYNPKNKDFEGWNGTFWISLTTGLKRGSVSDILGFEYETVFIKDTEWMAENLYTVQYRNGDPVLNFPDPDDWTNLSTGGASVFDNMGILLQEYGLLYNWYATVDPRGLCPTGWDMPAESDWLSLVEFLGGRELSGIKMKEPGLDHWSEQTEITGFENESGFTAFGGSHRNAIGIFLPELNVNGFWWSKTPVSNSQAFGVRLFNSQSSLQTANHDKRKGFSVRCVKK